VERVKRLVDVATQAVAATTSGRLLLGASLEAWALAPAGREEAPER
jgi:hypothetical protein